MRISPVFLESGGATGFKDGRERPELSPGGTRGTAVSAVLLSNLLADASAALDSDRATAKAYIPRALRSCPNEEQLCAHGPKTCLGSLAPWQQARVARYFEDNIGSSIHAADLARIARLSIGHFFRAFRKSFGESPQAYVAKQRIRRSQVLMMSSRASLAWIAVDCGMSDQPHFTHVFRRIVGMTPGVWRRQFTDVGASFPSNVSWVVSS
jgi:AraC family transcriptional regulator